MSQGQTRVLILAADYFEESELLYPVLRLREEGIRVDVAGIGTEPVTGKAGYGPYQVDLSVDQADSHQYDAIVVPGGFAPDILRRSDEVLGLVREFDAAGKPVALICHGGWVAISAGILSGRKATSVPAIRVDMENAGVSWVDEPVVVDGNLITARVPADLGSWMRALINALS